MIRQIKNLLDLVNTPDFTEDPELIIGPALSSILVQTFRSPHKYAHVFFTEASAEHLSELASNSDMPPSMFGEGVSIYNSAEAIRISMFEAMERVWSCWWDAEEMVVDTYRNLGEKALSPKDMVLMTDSEYSALSDKYVRYTDDLSLKWVSCHEICANSQKLKELYIPSIFVFTGYSASSPKERIVPMLSSGLSAGERMSESISRGIFEIIERDALMLTWLNKLSCARVNIGALLKESKQLCGVIEELNKDGFEIEIVKMCSDLPYPSLLVAIRNRDTGIRSFGMACGLNPYSVVEKAVTEAIKGMLVNYDFSQGNQPKQKKNVLKGDFDFLFSSDQEIEISEMPCYESDNELNDFMKVVAELNSHGYRVLYRDMTPEPIKGLSRYCLTRVFIPGMQPHLYETDAYRLDNTRLLEVPRKYGFKTTGNFNLAPNPFIVGHLTGGE